MTEQSDWHLPTATVTRAVDLRPEPKPQPLSYVEQVALDTHPATREQYPFIEWTDTPREWAWLCFIRWQVRTHRLTGDT